MSNKTDLSWLKGIFENYIKEQQGYQNPGYYMSDTEYFRYEAKINAATELLENIKQFIKEANELTIKE